MMLQNCFNKVSICIAHNLQLTPEHDNVILGVRITIINEKKVQRIKDITCWLTILSLNFMQSNSTMMFTVLAFLLKY